MNQLNLHNSIDKEIDKKLAELDATQVRVLVDSNFDSKRYFFDNVPVEWLSWLWENSFLDAIKRPAEDPTRYSYQTPELDFLSRSNVEDPTKVAEIMQSVEVTETNLNPEVVDRFLRIIGEMPAEQITTLTSKVRDEKWVYLMKGFRQSGYDFKEIVKKLSEAKQFEALLEIAKSIFTIKQEESAKGSSQQLDPDHLFYVTEIDDSGIYDALANIDEEFVKKALESLLEVLSEIVRSASRDESGIVEYDELFSLYDTDFFNLNIDTCRNGLSRDEGKSLLAIIKVLIDRQFNSNCNNAASLYDQLIDPLPTSRMIWRLQLFAMSRCPEQLIGKLEEAYFRMFEVGDRYFYILGETEYEKTLKAGFGFLEDDKKRTFVQKVFDFFGDSTIGAKESKYRKIHGLEILSVIHDQLTEDESTRCKQVFGKEPSTDYEPRPSIGIVRGGTIQNQSPVSPSDFSVVEIAQKLQADWTPLKLAEDYKDDDFLRPRGTEGLADAIKDDVKKRLNDYLDQLPLFFNREKVAPHYLYSILRAIEELLRDEQSLNSQQIEIILNLFNEVCVSGKESPFKRSDDKSWLGDWVTVHRVVADILLELFRRKSTKDHFYPGHRSKVTGILQYLLTFAESPSSDEERPEYGQLHHIAINSVRGRAFESLVNLVYLDGEVFRDDAKALYCQVLEDPSLAVRFLVGRYLASFYTRDKAFVEEKLPVIFPKDDPEKFDVYLATWEGYLSNSLYQELCEVLKPYYLHAISLEPSQYTDRKYFKELDEALAVHVALVFAYFDKDMNSDLFQAFWKQKNTKRHHEFISFLGRDLLSRGQTTEKKLEVAGDTREKLVNFWDWILDQSNIEDPEVLSAFGFWINPDREVLTDTDVIERLNKTLKKSNGDLEWEYGFLNRLVSFAQKNPTTTLELITNYMLSPEGNLNQHQSGMLRFHDEMKEALRIIYGSENGIYKEQVTELVSTLIEKGSQRFWGLKEILV